jgi:uncharacterized pyridoxal phosphate-containing UPF0001 family protein
MDLNQITSIQELESLAYRQLMTIKAAEQNLAALDVRMQQLAQEQEQAEAEKPKK